MLLKSFRPYAVLLSTILCAAAVRPATAQVLYGSVIGTVTDQSDSVIPGATVTLTNKDTGLAKEVSTDLGGRYSQVNVLPGRYDIEIVDLLKNPRLAKDDQIVAIPTLVRKLPVPLRKIIGDLSDTERTLVGLQLRQLNEERP